jgi:acetyl esterase
VTPHPQSQALIDAAIASGRPPLHKLANAVEARRVFKETRTPLFPPVPQIGATRDLAIPGPGGNIPARLYRPLGSEAATPLPALVFFHGGGWVVGDLDTHDILCRELANRANCAVVSVDYRLAPEHKFPAAFDDSLAATRYVAERARQLGVDASRIAVGGDSAGGNLAAAVAIACRDHGGPALRFQLLIYPATDLAMRTNSHTTLGEGYLLTRDLMRYFVQCYAPDERDWADWRTSPMRAADLSRLPPAFVAAAELDPLVDEGKQYADRLAAAGVATAYKRYEGMLHGFYLYGGVIDMTAEAIADAAAALAAELR